MNRIEASIGGVFVAILAGCTSAPVPVARDVVVSPRPEPRPVMVKWQGCIEWPNDCDEGLRNPNAVIRDILGRLPNGPHRSVDTHLPVSGDDMGGRDDASGDVGEGHHSDNPVKGNASANNGTGGNYSHTGHQDNGKGNGRGRK